MSELKNVIKSEFATPSPELVKLLTKRIYDGVITQKILDQFTDLVKRTFANHINDVMSERLNVAIKSTEEVVQAPVETIEEEHQESKIVTTAEELEAFYIVKSILRNNIPSERITYRDAQSYFAIFVDDNNRKPVCRLYFNTAVKSIGIFDADKNEVKHKLDTLDEIYNYQEELRKAIQKYL